MFYEIVSSNTTRGLEEKVNDYIKRGFKPQGSSFFGQLWFHQAMIYKVASQPSDPADKVRRSHVGLEGTKIDTGSHRMSDGFYESEFNRDNYR